MLVEKSDKPAVQQPQTQSSFNLPTNNQIQLAIFSHGLNLTQSTVSTLATQQNEQKHKQKENLVSNSKEHQTQMIHEVDIKNRLQLFNYIYYLFKASPVCTQLVHEKFTNVSDMDNYCKRNSILNYIYLNNSESQAIMQISKIFQRHHSNNQESKLSTLTTTSHDDDYNLNNIEFSIRIFSNSKGTSKYIDKKYILNDFLFSLHKFLNSTFTPFVSLSSIISPIFNVSTAASNLLTVGSSQLITQCIELVINGNSTVAGHHHHSQQQQQLPQQQQIQQQQAQNILSQTNIIVLLETSTRSSTPATSSGSTSSSQLSSSLTNSNSSLNNLNLSSRNSNANFKKIESQIITRLMHVLQLFSTRTRIEVIAIEINDSVLQLLANSIHLESDEAHFDLNWKEFLDKLDKLNSRCRRQIINFKLEELIRDLRYKVRSKVFIIYSIKSEQYKIFVAP